MQKQIDYITEFYEFFLKVLLPVVAAISIKVAVQIKNEGVNYTRIIISFVSGLGCAYLFFPLIEKNIEKDYFPLLIGLIAISGEKITEWVVYKFKVDVFLSTLAEFLLDKIKPKK